MASKLFTTNKMKIEEKSWLKRNMKAAAATLALSSVGIGTYFYMSSGPSDLSSTSAESRPSETKPQKAQPAFANSLDSSSKNLDMQGKNLGKGNFNKTLTPGIESLQIDKSGKLAHKAPHKGTKYAHHKKHKSSKYAHHKKHKSSKYAHHKKHKGSKYAHHKKHKGSKYAHHKKHKATKVVVRKKHDKQFSKLENSDDTLFDM
jgi:hypothetical protein